MDVCSFVMNLFRHILENSQTKLSDDGTLDQAVDLAMTPIAKLCSRWNASFKTLVSKIPRW